MIIPDYEHHSGEEFQEIAKCVRSHSPEIEVHVGSAKAMFWRSLLFRRKPTLYVALRNLKRWLPRGGKLLHGLEMDKSAQLDRIRDNGLLQTRYEKIVPGTALSSDEWGPVVVVKPERGARGKMVKVRKTNRVRWDYYSEKEEEWLAQEFVYTGKQPTSYRVQTIFGKTVYVCMHVNPKCGVELVNPTRSKLFGGHNIVASVRDAEVSLSYDEEIIAYAEEVSQKAFPEIPSLGLDILRDVRTGVLSVAEVNPWGHTWHVSSKVGKIIQHKNGICFVDQFGLIERTAEVLIRMTKECAA